MKIMYELSELSHLDTILARETNIDNIVGIRAQVEALRVYAVNIGKSKDQCQDIAMARIKAERRAGQVLLEIPKQNGARPPDTGFIDKIHQEITGILPSQRNSWQWIARLPDDLFEEVMKERYNSGEDITTNYFYEAARIHIMRQRGISTDKPYSPTTSEDLTKIFRYAFFKGAHWRAWEPPIDIEDAIEAAMNEWESDNES